MQLLFTSLGILNPSPGFCTQRDSAFLRPPFLERKTVGCFWKALSVYSGYETNNTSRQKSAVSRKRIVRQMRRKKRKSTHQSGFYLHFNKPVQSRGWGSVLKTYFTSRVVLSAGYKHEKACWISAECIHLRWGFEAQTNGPDVTLQGDFLDARSLLSVLENRRLLLVGSFLLQ